MLRHLYQHEKETARYKRVQAFGLAEVILGIFMLTSAVTVVMLPALQSIRYTSEDRRVVLAASLAQEGAEIVRNIRDNQFARADVTQTPLDKAFPSGMSNNDHKYCGVDLSSTALDGTNCNSSASAINKKIILSGGFYRNVSGANAPFQRLVDIKKISSTPSRYDVTVFVTWDAGNFISSANTTNCIRSNRCAFSQATFTDWNYWNTTP
jgi:hypothetical protein